MSAQLEPPSHVSPKSKDFLSYFLDPPPESPRSPLHETSKRQSVNVGLITVRQGCDICFRANRTPFPKKTNFPLQANDLSSKKSPKRLSVKGRFISHPQKAAASALERTDRPSRSSTTTASNPLTRRTKVPHHVLKPLSCTATCFFVKRIELAGNGRAVQVPWDPRAGEGACTRP